MESGSQVSHLVTWCLSSKLKWFRRVKCWNVDYINANPESHKLDVTLPGVDSGAALVVKSPALDLACLGLNPASASLTSGGSCFPHL